MTTPPPKPTPRAEPGSEPYWDAAAEGRLALQRCDRCQRTMHRPRLRCPHCWGRALTWIDASGRGTILTFTVVHQAPSAAFAVDAPYVLAVIELAEGPRMTANVIGGDPHGVRIGQPVEVVFETRAGGVKIPQFRVVRGQT